VWSIAASAAGDVVDNGTASSGRIIVTPDVLMDHLILGKPELAAMPELSWADNGRRVLLSMALDDVQTTRDIAPDDDGISDAYAIASIDVDLAQVTVIGPGYRPVAAPRGDTVAYYVSGANGHEIALARSNGQRLCSLRDRDLIPNATGFQSLALTADGKRLAFAIGYTEPTGHSDDRSSNTEAAVRVFDTLHPEPPSNHGVVLWTIDEHCREPRRVAKLSRYRIGQLAWLDRGRTVMGVAQTPVPGRTYTSPRTDLLRFDTKSGAWRTFISNIGGQTPNHRSGFLAVAPSGENIAFTYEQDGLAYQLRRQLAVASLASGRITLVSADPRQGAGWLDGRTLLITKPGAHPLLSRTATLSLDGSERDIGGIPGHAAISPDATKLAWLEKDLYGNSSLSIASSRRAGSTWAVGDRRVVWHAPSKLARYARGVRRFVECQSTDGVRPAAILVLPLGYAPGNRYPLLVDVHGGPRGGLDSVPDPYVPGSVLVRSTLEHDLWAAKGYAVLIPDYRASGLYGFDKIARDGSDFERDFEDIMCQVQAVIDQGIADAGRMAVIGNSHGAKQVTWIVTHTDRFKAAIAKEGSGSVNYSVAWGSRGQMHQQITWMLGAPYEHPEKYRRISVMDSVGGVSTPTMFVEHRGARRAGDLYPWMFAAWQAQGVRAQLRLYEEERHSLRRPADWRDVLDASIAWIDEHLAREPVTPLSHSAAPEIKLP
jgi:dipeptidyl aminopeptidase/acylaminoacyl peptidase